ncbi:MAG: sulfotransferase, partial [Emcibacteraceae bacterium]|nr:sulfotransferase [Emcibacteraceae bacterium]
MEIKQAIKMAAALANQGRLAESQKVCQNILRADDKFHPALHLLGQLALQGGRPDIAEQMLHKAAMIDPGRFIYQRDLAEVLFQNGKAKVALPFIKRATSLNDKDTKTHFVAGNIDLTIGDFANAKKSFEKVIKREPNHPHAHNNLGASMERMGDANGAKAAYHQALKNNVKNVEAHNNIASILIAEGELEDAKIHLKGAIRIRPDYIEAHHNLSGLKKYQEDDDDLKMLIKMAAELDQFSPLNQARLLFILGQAYADMNKYDQAFDHFTKGNNQMRAMINYDAKSAEKYNVDLKSAFNEDFFTNTDHSKNEDPTPIFIVGMPRSGSTLTEQILSSHDDVYAAGELTTLGAIIKAKLPTFPRGLDEVSGATFKSIGDAYLKEIKKHAPDAKRVIDKMPGNYQFIGLISKILPHAKIIHINRNAMDCCVSIYTRLFLQPIPYAYDLSELGQYYMHYQELMNHWEAHLSGDNLTYVKYEDVVLNFEEEARKLIKFVGLGWQDKVLDFNNQKSSVITASAAQVRKPIYKSSVNRWRVYENHLGILENIL